MNLFYNFFSFVLLVIQYVAFDLFLWIIVYLASIRERVHIYFAKIPHTNCVSNIWFTWSFGLLIKLKRQIFCRNVSCYLLLSFFFCLFFNNQKSALYFILNVYNFINFTSFLSLFYLPYTLLIISDSFNTYFYLYYGHLLSCQEL